MPKPRRIGRRTTAAVLSSIVAATGLGALSTARAVPAGPPGTIASVAGTVMDFKQYGFSGDGGPATAAQLYHPRAIAFDRAGSAYVADTLNNRIRRIDGNGTITTVAGSGVEGFSGDGGWALRAAMFQPHGVATDAGGNLYIADSGNNRIRRVDPRGVITTVAGTGVSDATGDDGPGTAAALKDPKALVVWNNGLYIADTGNNRIRRLDLRTGIITTVAGMTKAGFEGDGGPATKAQLNSPRGLWVSGRGSVYIADTDNYRIRRVSTDGTITTVAGTGIPGSGGDGGSATQAQFNEPRGITADAAGNLYVAEEIGERVRRIDTRGTITTVAGNGMPGFAGDGGPAAGAQFDHIRGIAYDGRGNLWVADTYNNRVRMISSVASAPGQIVPDVPPGTLPGPSPLPLPVPVPRRSGYWMLDDAAKIYPFGDAQALGDATGVMPPDAKAIYVASTPTGRGYWILDNKGHVFAFGDAFYPNPPVSIPPLVHEKTTSLSPTPTGRGFWIFTNRGRAFPFGDAVHLGDLAGTTLNGPVIASVATPTGRGYYMVASDGGVFAFGDAAFKGSMGGKTLNAPVESLVPAGTGVGYWLVAADGGIFSFGSAPFRGSMGDKVLNKPVVGMVRFGNGYLMVAADGGIFSFSDLPFAGSLGDNPPDNKVVYVAALDAPR